ncbi:VIP peptides-like [Anguilla rostrata]|uniref:VIP peptides-like n=1 Tax=Anguilla rostrata TaxID=7938 RepID=UPI0030CBAB0C
MLQRNGSQLLLAIALCSAFYSRTAGLPAIGPHSSARLGNIDGDNENNWTKSSSDSLPENYKLYYELSDIIARPTRHADGLFTSGYSKLLGQISARRYLDSLIGKRVSDDITEEQAPAKRHSDAVFTDNYSRFRKQMAVKKYLDSMLTGKRSLEDPPNIEGEHRKTKPALQETYDDVTGDELINQLPLTL